MRLQQHKGYGTAFEGLRSPIVHFALATGFLALHPGRLLDDGVPHRPLALTGRIKDMMHRVTLPSSTRNIHRGTRFHLPTKVHHRKPSSATRSSPTVNKTATGTIAASLISVGVGATLGLGRSTAQGDSSAGEGDSGNGGDDTTDGDSGRHGLGEGSPPPGDNPNDPPGARNGVVPSKSLDGHGCDAGGSPPPPPPPPTGCGVDDDMPGSRPPIFGPLTFLVLLSYLFGKRALDQRAKQLGLPLPDASSSSTTTDSSLDASPSVSTFLGSVNISSPLIVDVQPTWVSFEDSVDDESALSSISGVLEIALSSSPPPPNVEFWDVYGLQRIPAVLYQPMPSSPNVLLLHETTTCSVNDSPTPITVSALMRIMKSSVILFTVSLCGTVAFLLSFITCTGFANGAEPEDMDKVDFSRYDPNEAIVPFKPAELLYDIPKNKLQPDFFRFVHPFPQTIFATILDFFVTPEPQPEFYLLPPARPFVVPPLEHPAAFIEEVEEADIIDDALALVVFARPPFVENESAIVNAPPRGLDPLAPVFIPAERRVKPSSIPVFEAIQRGRRRPRPR